MRLIIKFMTAVKTIKEILLTILETITRKSWKCKCKEEKCEEEER